MTIAHILVADSDSKVAHDIEERLTKMGYAVSATLTSTQQAIDHVAAQPPDLVLVDTALSGKMDGAAAGAHIRKRFGIPVIYLTTHALGERDPFNVLSKPVEDVTLRATVEVALARHQAGMAVQQARDELEAVVERRTADLAAANKKLEAEIEERRQAETALQRRTLVLQTLIELSQAASATLEVGPILDTVAIVIAQALDATSVYVNGWNAEDNTSTVLAEYVRPEASASQRERESTIGKTYKEEESFADWMRDPESHFVDQISDPSLTDFERKYMQEFGLKSVLRVPFIAGEKAIGYVEVRETRRKREFNREEIEIVKAVVHQVGMAVHNAQLFASLEEAYLQVSEADRLKSEFLATMSHELRTPLHAINGYTQLMLAGVGGELNSMQRQSLERVLERGHHLLDLIDDILDLSLIEAGEMTLIEEPFDIRLWLSEVVTGPQAQARKKGLGFDLRLDGTLPVSIVGDTVHLTQIANNLLSNAIKFTEEGTIRLELGREGDKYWTLIVGDTGIGIAPKDQEYIFDAFRQVKSVWTREHGGTGLGLAIVKRLAMVMGGDVTVKSEVGQGSTFTVRLPLIVAHDS